MHYTTRRAAPGAARGGLHKSPTIRSGENGAAGALGVNLNLISPRFRRHPLHRRSGFLRVPCLVLLGAEVPRAERMRTQSQKRSMHSNVSGVAHSPASNAHACKLGLDEAHERLHGRVGLQRRDGPHRGLHAGVAHRLPEEQRRVLRAAARMVDASPRTGASGPWPSRARRRRARPSCGATPTSRRSSRTGRPSRPPGGAAPDACARRRCRRTAPGSGRPRRSRAAPGRAPRRHAGGPLRPALRPLGAPPGRPDPAVLAHDARHALARGAHAGPLQLGEDLRRPVDPAAGGARLGDRPRELPVAQVALARPARAPRVAAPSGYLRRGAHPRYAPAPLVEQDGREPRLLRPGPRSCPPAKKALAFESISLSRPSLSFSRPSRRRSSAVSKGPASASSAVADARPTRSARLDGSTPISRATSA